MQGSIVPSMLASWSNPANNTIVVTHSAAAKDGDTVAVSIAAL